MAEQQGRKTLTVTHDGKIQVSGYGVFKLGDLDFASIISDSLLMDKEEYRELNAQVTFTLTLKDKQPQARWIDADGE